MMADYEYNFAILLQQKLKTKIHGGVYITVDEDELIVKIIRDDAIDFKWSFRNFANRLRNGWTTEYAAYEFVNAYKECLMKRYFVH